MNLATGLPNREHSITNLVPESLPHSARPCDFNALDACGRTQAEV